MYIAIGTSESNATNAVQGYDGIRYTLGGNSSYGWAGIPNGTWFVAAMDSGENIGLQTASVSVSCTTTTTTTTTTQAPINYWYNAYRYECDTGFTDPNLFPVFSSSQLTVGRWYQSGGGYVYQIYEQIGEINTYITAFGQAFATAETACSSPQ